ncbi:MAG: hypothetical protein A3K75_01985 [Euryarchaeota archaeon RBG_13_61_15]|nr:MAG: hypothetical protein A3K75_01985 [Euryarchaeota archaeon RBG_13_61_15]
MDEEYRRAALEYMSVDFRTNLVVMRWLTFLLEKVKREALPDLFGYYERIGWMSERVKNMLVQVSEGAKPSERPPQEEIVIDEDVEDHSLLLSKEPIKGSKKTPAEETGWQLTPEDHIKSWAFLMEIKGEPVDKNLWCDLETRIDSFEFSVEEYYRI